MDKKQQDLLMNLSASFFRQMWFLRLCKIENDSFAASAQMSHPMFKNIHRVMKNCISTITQMEEQAIRILPKSEDKIKRVVDNDKVLVISSIVEKLSYMSLEDLEILDDDIKIDDNNVIIST